MQPALLSSDPCCQNPFRIDLRSLGCFRIAIATVLLYDVIFQGFDLSALYLDAGALRGGGHVDGVGAALPEDRDVAAVALVDLHARAYGVQPRAARGAAGEPDAVAASVAARHPWNHLR